MEDFSMKCFAVITALISVIVSIVISSSAFAKGGIHSGGGIYGKFKGQWVLIDELEEGTVFNPADAAKFSGVEQKLKEIEGSSPEFATELNGALTTKIWHLVQFELRCEEAGTPLVTNESAGACQNDHDVWIVEKKFKSADPSRLIVHELIQSARLKVNASRALEEKMPAANVRALYRALYRNPFPNETQLQKQLLALDFGNYRTRTEWEWSQKRDAEIEHRKKTIKQLGEECSSQLTSLIPKIKEAQARTPFMALMDGDSADVALRAATEMTNFFISYNDVYNSMVKSRTDIELAVLKLEYDYAIGFADRHDLKSEGAKCESAMKRLDQELSTFTKLLGAAKARLRK
jgi:hypothetical protein